MTCTPPGSPPGPCDPADTPIPIAFPGVPVVIAYGYAVASQDPSFEWFRNTGTRVNLDTLTVLNGGGSAVALDAGRLVLQPGSYLVWCQVTFENGETGSDRPRVEMRLTDDVDSAATVIHGSSYPLSPAQIPGPTFPTRRVHHTATQAAGVVVPSGTRGLVVRARNEATGGLPVELTTTVVVVRVGP